MERELLERLLAGNDEASVAALAALRRGGSHVVWDGTAPAEQLVLIHGRRLRHTRLRGIDDGSWTFMLFLTEDGNRLIACTGVRRVRT